MKDNKKHIRLLLHLLCLVICGAFLLAGCKNPGVTDPSTEPPTVADTTEGPVEDTTVEDTTEPEAEETTEETEPETTEAPSSSGGSSPGGTGGGYTPQTSEPATETTEPENETTEPEIEVPNAGTETNAYYENISAVPDSFSTVKIPAQSAMHYIVKTAGAFLRIESADVSVIYDGKTVTPENGVLQLQLPGGAEAANALVQFVNNGKQEQAFTVYILEELGAQSNPVILPEITHLNAKLEKDDADGLYYSWTADRSGILSLGLSSVTPATAGADIIVTVNEKTVKLSESSNGLIQIPVDAGEQVLVQVIAQVNGEGSYPAIDAVINGSVAPVAQLKAEQIPETLSTDEVAPGGTVYYNILGVNGTVLLIQDADATVICGEAVYSADENGTVTVPVAPGPEDQAVQLQIINGSQVAKKFDLQFDYPVGHRHNPEALTQLGEQETAVQAGTDGYFYQYTAEASGVVTFHIAVQPDTLGVRTDIILRNEQTQQETALWTEDAAGNLTQLEEVSMDVAEGDVISICVRVVDLISNSCVDAKLTVQGKLDSFQLIEFPGFTAKVAAGKTAYYEGYNLDDTVFCLTGEDVAVTHGGVTYIPKDGQILFRVTAESRMPAQFAIENRGAEDGEYEVTLSYLVGHRMNPDVLALGSSFVNQAAGADEYCFNYVAPKAGQLTLSFSKEAQWCYTVDNLTQQIYGETFFSDSEPAANTAVVEVAEGDEIQLRVNTYDPNAPWEAPAGSVEFAVTLVTDPVVIDDMSKPFVSTILAGETATYTGALQGTVITIHNAQNATLSYNGEYYEANEEGVLTLNFLEPNGGANVFSFTLHNRATEDWDCTMNISAINGGPLAPGELKLGVNAVNNPAGGAGYWFCYTAPKAGDLVLTFPGDANWSYAINDGDNQYSGTAEAEVTVAVESGDQVLVWVNTYDPENKDTAPAGTVSFEATLVSGPVEIADITVPFETTLLAGETVKYTGQLHGAVISIANAQQATLYYNGEPYEANSEGDLSIAFLEPNTTGNVEMVLHNRATEDWDCTMTVTAIPGGPLDPRVLQLGTGSVSNAEAGAAGGWFCYDASKNGTLVLTFDAEADWCYAVNGGQLITSDDENAVNTVQIPVRSGEKVMLWINTYDPANPDTAPAGDVAFTAALHSSPVELDLTKAYEAKLLTGETAVFTGQLRNAIVTIANANYFTVIYNGQEYEANDVGTIVLTCLEPDGEGKWQFAVRNNSISDQSCPMRFSGTVGSWLNPAEMVLGENTVEQAENAEEYCYSYTAPKSGTLILRFDTTAQWCYRINGGAAVYSDSEPVGDIAELTVEAGDAVDVRVNTYDPANPEKVPAGSVTFQASLTTAPVVIDDLTQPFTGELLVGETARYTGYFKDAVITVTDAENLIAYYGDAVYTANEESMIVFPFDDVLWEFSLENGADTDVSCTMTFTGEAGTWLNPAAMTLGVNTVVQEAGADDYYLSYQVPKTGELMLTFDDSTAWSYIIDDGEKQLSTAPDAAVVKLAVESGDTVLLRVNTYDPAAPDVIPAGEVSFAATLITGPVEVTDYEQSLLVTMLAGETVRVSGAPSGEKLTIDSAENLTVSCGGNVYTANEEGVITFKLPEAGDGETLEFTVYNGAQQDDSCIVVFGAEKGTADNPAVLVLGENTAICKAGSDGYYFTFTATRDCQIRLTFDKESTWAFDWDYTDGNSDKASTTWKFRSGKILAGQTITVLIKTYDPENPDVVPEGTVHFEMDIPT